MKPNKIISILVITLSIASVGQAGVVNWVKTTFQKGVNKTHAVPAEQEGYYALVKKVNANKKPTEHRMLADHSVLAVDDSGAIKIIRPPGDSRPNLTIEIPKDRNAILSALKTIPESAAISKDLFKEAHITVLKDVKPASTNIEIRLGNKKNFRAYQFDSRTGELISVQTKVPRLEFEFSRIGESNYRAMKYSGPNGSMDGGFELPIGSEVKNYSISSLGHVHFQIRHANGKHEIKDFALTRAAEAARNSAKAGTQATHQLPSVSQVTR